MRISDWSSDVCSSDLFKTSPGGPTAPPVLPPGKSTLLFLHDLSVLRRQAPRARCRRLVGGLNGLPLAGAAKRKGRQFPLTPLSFIRKKRGRFRRSEEHTSELQSLMRISYAVFCLKQKIQTYNS